MATQKTIAIIGALEEVAEKAIGVLKKSGFHLLLFYKQSDEYKRKQLPLAEEPANIEWVSCPKEASWEADAVILAIPAGEYTEIASDIRFVTTGKPVINIRNNSISNTALQQLLPDSVVVYGDVRNVHILLNDFFKR